MGKHGHRCRYPCFLLSVLCYDCLFLRRLADNYKINKIAYDSEVDKHEQVFCALNNTLKIKLQMNNIHERCPINLAIEANNPDSKD